MFDFDDIEEDVKKKGTGAWTETKSAPNEDQVAVDVLRLTRGSGGAGAAAAAGSSAGASTSEKASASAAAPASPVLPALPQSDWLGSYRRNPSARIRLFAVLGVGCPAATYTDWVSPETIARFPDIEVAVLELPGHGFNSADAYYSPSQAAKGIAGAVSLLQFRDQKKGEKRPFALYGFSMGALLLWDAARQIVGGEGETCSRLYISCRGGPHLTSPPILVRVPIRDAKDEKKADDEKKPAKADDEKKPTKEADNEKKPAKEADAEKKPTKEAMELKPKVKRYGKKQIKVKFPKPGERPDFSSEDPEELFDMSMGNFEETVDEAQLQKYDRYLSMLLKKDPKKLVSFVETQYCDTMIASRGIDIKKERLPLKVKCPVHFYHSDADEVWPPDNEAGYDEQKYESLVGSWEKYAPSSEKFSSTCFPGIPHGDMGSPFTPAFLHMMEDLSKLIATGLV